jgi:Spy/CpxP family protein refolding chaperone
MLPVTNHSRKVLKISFLNNFSKNIDMKIKILGAAILLCFAMKSQAQGGGGPRGGDPVQRAEMQTKMMVDSLSLSSKQGEKVKEINLKYAKKRQETSESMSADGGNWQLMKGLMEDIRNEQNAELRTVLTKEQYDHWLKIADEQMKQRGGKGRGNGGNDGQGKKGTPPPPQPPPLAPELGGN